MNLIREWITALAGIISIAAICDTIMIDGEMKKYLKPVLGFVIIIIVVQPIAGISGELSFNVPDVTAHIPTDFSKEIEVAEQKNVIKLYQQKLAGRVENEIKNLSDDYISVTACVTAENSGEIKNVTINLNQEVELSVSEKIKETVSKKFAVDVSNISIIFGKG